MGKLKLGFNILSSRAKRGDLTRHRVIKVDCHVASLLAMTPILFLFFILTGCGGVKTNTTPPPTTPTVDVRTSAQPMAVILGADYDRGASQVGSISLLGMNTPRTATKNIQTTHSDAIVRVFNNKIYVVNRLGGDNLQVIDSQNFRVTLQCSVGLGTNPQDIVVVSDTKAFISLYQPSNNRSSLSVDDIVIVNPSVTDCAQFITGSIDLQPYTSASGIVTHERHRCC
ncbi:MAG: hypothetical protein IPJ69_05825 [Deltaproteobacteria bacterium]|nr:MAG: hypothetical protein IPJ69_05825 [Deltaproteobacteria bacterium]